MITIGILNLQGAVSEHFEITQKAIDKMGIDGEVVTVRYADEVSKCDGVIISGGESTVIGKLIKERGIDRAIKDNEMPVFGTCAGMVLLSKKTDHQQPLLELMDIEVKRNAFGRQRDSFERKIAILRDEFQGVFIRAPAAINILNTDSFDEIEVLSKLDSQIIAIRQENNVAISFHPELTEDTRLHEYFLNIVLNNR